jgi:hypothetical protein
VTVLREAIVPLWLCTKNTTTAFISNWVIESCGREERVSTREMKGESQLQIL